MGKKRRNRRGGRGSASPASTHAPPKQNYGRGRRGRGGAKRGVAQQYGMTMSSARSRRAPLLGVAPQGYPAAWNRQEVSAATVQPQQGSILGDPVLFGAGPDMGGPHHAHPQLVERYSLVPLSSGDVESVFCRFRTSIASEIEPATCISHSTEGKLVALGGDKLTRICSVSNGQSLHRLLTPIDVHQECFTRSVCFVGNDSLSLVASEDGLVRLWHIGSTKLRHTFKGHSADAVSVCQLPGRGDLFVSGSADGTVRMWDLESGKCVQSFGSRGGPEINSVAVGPDSNLIAAGGTEGLVKLFDARTARPVGEFKGHEDAIFSVCGCEPLFIRDIGVDSGFWQISFSPLGLVASASLDHTTRCWDARVNGKQNKKSAPCIHVSRTHTDIVLACAFSEDGRWLASGGNDSLVCFTDVSTMTPEWQLHGFDSGIVAMSWSTGSLGLTNGQEKAVLLDFGLW